MSVFIDVRGQKFGRLLVLKRVYIDGSTTWRCLCDCGKRKNIRSGSLRSGMTKSCGCLDVETKTTHGRSYDPIYNIWQRMAQRCYNTRYKRYYDYGGRGIRVCKRWRESFEAFLEDMGERPAGLSLERKNNDGNYTKRNCKWATAKEQANNRRPR